MSPIVCSRKPSLRILRSRRLTFVLGWVFAVIGVTGTAGAQLLNTSAVIEPDKGCNWLESGVNFAYPETHALYFQAVLPADRPAGSRVRITGEYYAARYFSLQLYGPGFEAIDALADYQLEPQPGSRSPLEGETVIDPAVSPGGQYTATIEFGDKPANPAPNTLYAGEAARSGKRIYLYLRAYLSSGVLHLPDLRLESGSTSEPFASPQTSIVCRSAALKDQLGSASGQTPDGQSSPPLQIKLPTLPLPGIAPIANRGAVPFSVYYGIAGGLGGTGVVYNQNAGFMAATIQSTGDLVLVRLRAPSYPELRGAPVPDVRYWSLCQNRKRNESVLACIADKQAAIDLDGMAYFLIADAGSSTAALGSASGFAVLPSLGIDEGYLIYRQILARGDFIGAIKSVPKDQDPYRVLGDYAPLATYCAVSLFTSNAARGETPAQIFAACNATP